MAMIKIFTHAKFKKTVFEPPPNVQTDELVTWSGFPVELWIIAFQYHARTFTEIPPRSHKRTADKGFRQGVPLQRVQGYLKTVSSRKRSVPLAEYRISCQVISTTNLESPVYKMFFLSNYEETFGDINLTNTLYYSAKKLMLHSCS